ncbi:MAG: DUF4255 domain-containing protein [Chloroflexi bacterium]|nr:DUF4255 domain-containing protein [Chloroflexota bacterium]
MSLLDLSLVTQTFLDLITVSIDDSSAWTQPNPPDVDPYPPDRLIGDNAVGFYLYHMTEESQGKNTYLPGVSDAPIRYIPMGLNLYYLLTAHSDMQNENGILREQLLMGLAMKALHDYPLVTDDTRVAGQQVMHPDLRGRENRFRVTLLPVKPEDSVTYWTAGQAPLRLSAYYQVSVAYLEPDEPLERAGRVLAYGVYVFPSDSQRVETTTNTITFTLPGEIDPRSLDLRPAQVTYDQTFDTLGSAFAGDAALMIRRADWDAAVEADAAWNVQVSGSRVRATVRQQSSGQDIIPGIYAASVRVQRSRLGPGGTKILEQTSNETPFVVVPRVDNITVPNAQGQFTVTGATFQHADITAEMVSVFVGAARLAAGDPLNLQPGQYAITDAATLQVRLPAGLTPGESMSFRLIINGAETAPLWVVVP